MTRFFNHRIAPIQQRFLLMSPLLIGTLVTVFTHAPAKAATAYFYYETSAAGANNRLITSTGGTTVGDSLWGTFEVPDSIAEGSEVGNSTFTFTGAANISYSGKPTSGSGYGGSAANTYTRWAYNQNTDNLFFFGTGGQIRDSLRLSLAGGLIQGGNMRVTGIDWCSTDSHSGGSTSCSSSLSWTLGNGATFIRVPSPAIAAGVAPFLLLVIARRKRFKYVHIIPTRNAAALVDLPLNSKSNLPSN